MPDLHPDSLPRRTATLRPPLPAPVLHLGAAALAAVAPVALLAFLLVGPVPGAIFLAVAGHLLGTGLALPAMARGHPHDRAGLGNLVTLVRLAVTAALLAPLLAPGQGWTRTGLALCALLLDGLDGPLARRQQCTSPFGARFDMEVDAALGLILALNAWVSGTVGPLVLLLGLPRYLFLAAGRVLPWLNAPLPERIGRKAACVVQIAVLVALQAPVTTGALASLLVVLGIAVLGWSFGRDLLWLRRARS